MKKSICMIILKKERKASVLFKTITTTTRVSVWIGQVIWGLLRICCEMKGLDSQELQVPMPVRRAVDNVNGPNRERRGLWRTGEFPPAYMGQLQLLSQLMVTVVDYAPNLSDLLNFKISEDSGFLKGKVSLFVSTTRTQQNVSVNHNQLRGCQFATTG